jgi:hypothetical protein
MDVSEALLAYSQALHAKRRVIRRPAADVYAASKAALTDGGEVIPHPVYPDAAQHVVWDQSRGCLAPWFLLELGDPHFTADVRAAYERAWQPARSLERRLACRTGCPVCLEHRGRLWTAKMISEFQDAVRTWMLTLTYSPEVRYLRELEARKRFGEAAFDRLSRSERTVELVRECGEDLTKLVKLLRYQMSQNVGLRGKSPGLRYCAVAEAHKDGFPHFHLVLHETKPDVPLRKAVITAKWEHGHSVARLVDDVRGIAYVGKYLSKDALSRVRASVKYGGIYVPEVLERATPKF